MSAQSSIAERGARCSDGAHAGGADLVESSLDSRVEFVELTLHLVLRHDGGEELHGVDAVNDIAVLFAGESHLDGSHGELLGAGLLSVENDTDAAVVEEADSLHHANGLPERAVVIVIREGVLLEELILNDGSSL